MEEEEEEMQIDVEPILGLEGEENGHKSGKCSDISGLTEPPGEQTDISGVTVIKVIYSIDKSLHASQGYLQFFQTS